MKETQTDLDLSGYGVQLLNSKRDLFLEPIFSAQERCWDESKSHCAHFFIIKIKESEHWIASIVGHFICVVNRQIIVMGIINCSYSLISSYFYSSSTLYMRPMFTVKMFNAHFFQNLVFGKIHKLLSSFSNGTELLDC